MEESVIKESKIQSFFIIFIVLTVSLKRSSKIKQVITGRTIFSPLSKENTF